MATEDQIKAAQEALINAHNAGDEEAARRIADHIVSLQSQKEDAAPVDRTLGNTAGAAVGGIGGAALGRSLQAGIREEYPQMFRGTPKPAAPSIPNITVTGAPEATALHGGEKWAQKLTGVEVPGAQMNKASLDTARTMAETVGRGGELAGGTIKGGIMVGPQTAAERISGQAAEEVAKKASMLDRAKAAAKSIASSDTLKSANRNVGHVMHGMTNPWAIKTLGNALAGAGAGMQAADAYQRFQDPNQGFIRGAISGLGALGSGAAMTRIPAAMPIGMAVGTAAPFVNEYLDEWAKKHPEAAKRLHLAEGGRATSTEFMRKWIQEEKTKVVNKAEGGILAPHEEHMQKMAKGGSVLPKNQYMPSGAKADLAKRQGELEAGGPQQVFKSAAKETYDNPIINNALAALPVTGDLMNAADVWENVKQGNYGTAGLGAAAGMLPFGAGITKNIKPETLEMLSRYFDPSAIEAIKAPLDYKSRQTTVLMSPDEFLSYAAKITPNKGKMADIEQRFATGDKIGADNLPFLQLEHEGQTSNIYGHEGRHRANYLKQQGVDLMPVNVKSPYIRWSEQTDPKRFDYVENWPQTLRNQDLTISTPFPLTREGEYHSSMNQQQTLSDPFWRKEPSITKEQKSTLDALERELLAKEFEDYFKKK